MSNVSDEDIKLVIETLSKKYGDKIPNPDHYPKMFKTLVKHELFYITRERENPAAGNS